MKSLRTIAAASTMLVLALSGCATSSYEPESVLPVRAELSVCPRPPIPPAELMKRPAILDFLPSSLSATSSPQSRPSSSTP